VEAEERQPDVEPVPMRLEQRHQERLGMPRRHRAKRPGASRNLRPHDEADEREREDRVVEQHPPRREHRDALVHPTEEDVEGPSPDDVADDRQNPAEYGDAEQPAS
jgi:hypothetical protein